MFPPIYGNQQPQMYQESAISQQGYSQNNSQQLDPRMMMNPDAFTMNPTPFHNYYMEGYAAPVNQYQEDLDEYFYNNKDKLLAKWNVRYQNPQPPLGGINKFSMPQLPRIRLPAVDWENFKKDAEGALKRKNGFLRNLNNKVQIMDNLLQQSDDWLVERYRDQKERFAKAGFTKQSYKLSKSLQDYKKFQNKYYGLPKNREN